MQKYRSYNFIKNMLSKPIILIIGLFMYMQAYAQNDSDIERNSQELRGGEVIKGYSGVVDLAITGGSSCTGSMIAPNVILTAAHCFFPVGSTNDPRSGTRFVIINYYDPERGRRPLFTGFANWGVTSSYNGLGNYGAGEANDDIGFIRIPTRFNNTSYKDYLRLFHTYDLVYRTGPYSFDHYEDLSQDPTRNCSYSTSLIFNTACLQKRLTAIGAGRYRYSSADNDNKLRTHWFEVENVEYYHIVTDNRKRVSMCLGDSGGPLLYGTELHLYPVVGITGVLSQSDIDDVFSWSEGPNCANNEWGLDDSFYARITPERIRFLETQAGIKCELIPSVDERFPHKAYRRCFDIPYIEDIDYEGLDRNMSVAIVSGAVF